MFIDCKKYFDKIYRVFLWQKLLSQNVSTKITKAILMKLVDVLVSPVLNYSSDVSGYFESKDIENVHLKNLCKLLCVNNSTNLSRLYGESL